MNRTMPGRSSKPKDYDFTTVARRVVERAIGEKWDGSPLLDKDAGKKPGGYRARQVGRRKRSAIAKKAAQARWGRTWSSSSCSSPYGFQSILGTAAPTTLFSYLFGNRLGAAMPARTSRF